MFLMNKIIFPSGEKKWANSVNTEIQCYYQKRIFKFHKE